MEFNIFLLRFYAVSKTIHHNLKFEGFDLERGLLVVLTSHSPCEIYTWVNILRSVRISLWYFL